MYTFTNVYTQNCNRFSLKKNDRTPCEHLFSLELQGTVNTSWINNWIVICFLFHKGKSLQLLCGFFKTNKGENLYFCCNYSNSMQAPGYAIFPTNPHSKGRLLHDELEATTWSTLRVLSSTPMQEATKMQF